MFYVVWYFGLVWCRPSLKWLSDSDFILSPHSTILPVAFLHIQNNPKPNHISHTTRKSLQSSSASASISLRPRATTYSGEQQKIRGPNNKEVHPSSGNKRLQGHRMRERRIIFFC